MKRPPGDQFSFRLFFQLISKITKVKDALYFWSSCIDPKINRVSHYVDGRPVWETELTYRQLLLSNITKSLVVMGIKDHLTSGDFNPSIHIKPVMVEYLENLFKYYGDKKFILFTSVENLESYIRNENVIIIPWGGDIVNHQMTYRLLEPILDKNLDSKTTFLSLNRNPRTHRAMLVSLLYKLGLQHHGLISCMFKEQFDNLFEFTQWQTSKQAEFEEGFSIFKQSQLDINDDYNIYTVGENDNVHNFKNKLTPYYQNTFVEIITETSYTESCYNLTEKTLNSIYGCCFPILLCSKGSVDFLRTMGMDVFDDIVDHSYDTIEDPTDRLYRAVTDNLELLTDNQKTKELWQKHRYRFVDNVAFAKTTMYNFYTTRATTLLQTAIEEHDL
jgi:hypothetical protein